MPAGLADPKYAYLLAQVDLRLPGWRRLLVAAPRSDAEPLSVARGLAHAAADGGQDVRIARLSAAAHLVTPPRQEADFDTPPAPGELAENVIGVSDLRDPQRAARALGDFDGLTIVSGRGLLDDASTLLAVRAVEGVLVAVWQGRNTRVDLEECAREVREGGGCVVGAALVH